ncbi:MAG: tartrate dehydrogenase [Alphaproteobacteria bacterium]|nr:tartrate dehydrogenase [Alphaproteobacteria bacterium]
MRAAPGRSAAAAGHGLSADLDNRALLLQRPRPFFAREADLRTYSIGVVPGDGIGKEVVPEGLRVLDAAARRFGFKLELAHYPWSCETYKETGRMMPADGLDKLGRHDAIFLGAVGYPGVPDHVSLWGLLIPIRRQFKQYANVRPVRLLPGLKSPLAGRGPADIDMLIVRENNEGEYSEIGGRLYAGTDAEMAMQQSVFTRRGVDRILRYAFNAARDRPKRHVTSATKSNGIIHTMPYWDERFAAVGAEYPDIKRDQYHIDILTAHFVQHPDWFDVVVGSNLFGDILSDLGPAVAGSIGVAASGNINPEKEAPSMFEPVHGSAPDIAGRGIANPIAQVCSGAMMLEHLGEKDAAAAILGAVDRLLSEGGPRTRDIGGQAGTVDVGKALAAAI